MAEESVNAAIVRILELDALSSRVWSSNVLGDNLGQLSSWAFGDLDTTRSVLYMHIVHFNTICKVKLDVGTIVALEWSAGWTRLGTLFISIGNDLDIFKFEVLTLPAEYTNTIGSMVDHYVANDHISNVPANVDGEVI